MGQKQFQIREISPRKWKDEIQALHRECFGDSAPLPDGDELYNSQWWFATYKLEPVAFAGLTNWGQGVGYLYRTGVCPAYRQQGLHRRLITVRVASARKLGREVLVTDTTENNASSNNLIWAGFTLFLPPKPWGFKTKPTLYWRMVL